MEVHHHPQLHHKEKPWKEYLLEGIMIFLAVTLGFFAESYREHLNEHVKEHEYMMNIRKDMITERNNLDIWIPALYTRVKGFDTLISYLETDGKVKDGSHMYYLARMSTRNSVFEPSDNTISEMKSSGNLRLIRSRDIVNGLMDIERLLSQYKNVLDIEAKEDVMSYPLLGEFFDVKVFNSMMNIGKNRISTEREYASQRINIFSPPAGNPQLISHDKTKLNQLVYYLHLRESSFLGETRQLMSIRKLVEHIIIQIDKEYPVKND